MHTFIESTDIVLAISDLVELDRRGHGPMPTCKSDGLLD